MNMDTKNEIKIAKQLIKAFLEAGYSLGVNDGEETTLTKCTDGKKVFDAMRTTDMDRLIVYGDGGKRIGAVLLVWGNGEDVITDNTDTPAINAILDPVMEAL